MKRLKIPLILLACTLAGTVARAADPQPAPAAPDIQALIAMFHRLAAEAGVELVPQAAEAPAPAAKAPADSAPAAGRPTTTGLKVSSLTPSAPLGGRGAGAPARATETDWRALFPLKQARN